MIIRLEAMAAAEYWIYCTGQLSGVYAFGYNSAENLTYLDEIWSTQSTLLGAGPRKFWARSAQ